jgi:hypothetical protein
MNADLGGGPRPKKHSDDPQEGRQGAAGQTVPFSVGALAHLLKNRSYVGEIAYRGEIYPGDHEPIIGRKVFEAVQAKLAANAVERRLQRRASASLLTGRIFDDRGNRMSPTHTNKRGARYRYYVSRPVLQRRAKDAGSVTVVWEGRSGEAPPYPDPWTPTDMIGLFSRATHMRRKAK